MRMMVSTFEPHSIRRGHDGLLIEKKMGSSSRLSRHACGDGGGKF
jgi:hypothetical protein